MQFIFRKDIEVQVKSEVSLDEVLVRELTIGETQTVAGGKQTQGQTFGEK
jgi:hypothetical protein